MAFDIQKTLFEGLMVINPIVIEDERGYFIKDFEKDVFKKLDIDQSITETYESKSRIGTLRGLHFQSSKPQAKLIRVVKGSIFDVCVDLRKGSPTELKWFSIVLSEENHKMIYIPKGFAHGFLTLKDNTIFTNKCFGKYYPDFDAGIRYDDPYINVQWPWDCIGGESNVIISDKDKNWDYIDFI